ncbi:MAG TPA: MlaD family protein [Solirubrobacteraceae bacterium]|jgi:virulence factor Mce-like protein|nr:MlaD family protein [Solirubrobacteraceae bacterium]
MNRGRGGSIVANPTLVGAVTTLVVIVAVFLAYNANNGLPFVPTREVKVQIASGSNLVKGNEVREGGYRIGVVSKIEPIAVNGTAQQVGSETGVDRPTVGAQLTLKLDKKVGTIPADSTVSIRPRSALGLKYIEFTRGRSTSRYLRDGETIPISQTSVPVQFDQVYKIFDTPTRQASRDNLVGFGNAFVGRGTDLNQTISLLPPFFKHLEAVTHNLADSKTGFARFFRALDRTARTVAPVAEVNSRLFTDMATTFEAFSRDQQALKDTIAKSPATLDVSTQSLHDQLPFLKHSAQFGTHLTRATAELRAALPTINSALEIGTPVTRRSVALNQNLQQAMVALRDLAQAPTTNAALRGLTATMTTLNPTLRYLGPFVTVCNYFNYYWTFVAEHFSEGDVTGSAQRALLNSANHQTNSIGSAGASTPANGNSSPVPNEIPEYTHGQPYGAAISSTGKADCEGVQRGYPSRIAKYVDPKYIVAGDPHTPGGTGPVFRSFDDRNKRPSQRQLGTPQVPSGETFTRDPGGIGAPLP